MKKIEKTFFGKKQYFPISGADRDEKRPCLVQRGSSSQGGGQVVGGDGAQGGELGGVHEGRVAALTHEAQEDLGQLPRQQLQQKTPTTTVEARKKSLNSNDYDFEHVNLKWTMVRYRTSSFLQTSKRTS